jgi:hypothetical protein
MAASGQQSLHLAGVGETLVAFESQSAKDAFVEAMTLKLSSIPAGEEHDAERARASENLVSLRIASQR